MWVLPPEHNGAFVAHMEEVLAVYPRPDAPQVPMVCMDAQPVQLMKEVRQPLPAVEGQPDRDDYEYERNGTANIFLFTEPLRGLRSVSVKEHRTALDWATEIQQLLDIHCDLPSIPPRTMCRRRLDPGDTGPVTRVWRNW